MKLIRIYCIIDPRNNLPFYIGCTKNKLSARLSSHCGHNIYYQNGKNIKNSRIIDIKKSGLRPVIKTLIISTEDKSALLEECFYNYFTIGGIELLNTQKSFK